MSKKINIQIKSIWGDVLFEHESEDNTIKQTINEANLRGANLRGANLYEANLREADLCEADLRGANLRWANLYEANLREADLREADLYGANLYGANLREANLREANLRGANLYGANLKLLPVSFINQCSRDMLYIFHALRSELPYLREKLLAGEVDGTQYEGECACLIGSLAKAKKESADKVCEYIPYYDKGLHNPSEQWFWQIRKGDTPENNQFSAYALELIDKVIQETK